jgi:DNA-binding winged helix-turn-helix (wHTH) protein
MAERIYYEFDGFRLDQTNRELLQNGKPQALPLKAFELLLILVRNHGRHVTKEQLLERVWPDAFASDNTFNVTLHAARKALGDPKRKPRYIVRVPDGYCFIADVREIVESEDQELETSTAVSEELNQDSVKGGSPGTSESAAQFSSRYFAHVLLACSLYAALYATCVILEIAYQFNQFGRSALRIMPLVFAWMLISSATALIVDRKLTLEGRAGGLFVSTAVFLIAAGALFGALSFYLPAFPITESALQTYPAQAAYLKDTAYFLVLGLLFLIPPFHLTVTLEREIRAGRSKQVLDLLSENRLSVLPKSAVYLRVRILAILLMILLVIALILTTWLLDHLKPGPYMNLFTQLVYLRGILYFGLGLECLIWYYRSLSDLKRGALIQASPSAQTTNSEAH